MYFVVIVGVAIGLKVELLFRAPAGILATTDIKQWDFKIEAYFGTAPSSAIRCGLQVTVSVPVTV